MQSRPRRSERAPSGAAPLRAGRGAWAAAALLLAGCGGDPLATAFRVELPASANADDTVTATITALGAAGAVFPGYTGALALSADDTSAEVPATVTFAAADSGVKTVQVTFHAAGSWTLSARDTGASQATGSAKLTVGPPKASAFRIDQLPASLVVDGQLSATVSAVDKKGRVVASYLGTAGFTSDDASADLPAAAAFAASDRGVKAVQLTFHAPGTWKLTATDSAQAALTGTVSIPVAPLPAVSFKVVLPATAEIGSAVTAAVTAVDGKGRTSSNYTGTVKFTSDDAAAVLPASAVFAAADAGTKSVQVTFNTLGTKALKAADAAQATLIGSGTTSVTPLPAVSLRIDGFPATAGTGAGVPFTLVALDRNGARAGGYLGTINFTSTDPAAAGLLPPYTFTAADGGSHAFATAFTATGAQKVTATDSVNAALTVTSAAVTVTLAPGLAYTNPAAGAGKLRLVWNAASTSNLIVLDLVANASLSGWAVGMNLPFDSTRAQPGPTLITAGAALDPGQAPQAFKAVVPASGPLAGMLVSGLSQKAGGAGAQASDKALKAGDVLYTLEIALKAGAPAGVVFDGQSLGARFRAGLRNKAGDEVVAQADFAIGKLEVH